MPRPRSLPLNLRSFALAVALVQGLAGPSLAQETGDWARADEIASTVRLPQIPALQYVITAPAAAPLRDVTLRNVTIGEADRTFLLKNVEGLTLENLVIAGQRADGRLDWRQTLDRKESR